MKSILTPLKLVCIKHITHNTSALSHISKYQFGQQVQIEKSPENSDEENNNPTQLDELENPLIETLRQSEAFQAVSNSDMKYRPPRVVQVETRRQSRTLWTVDESAPFSGILHAKNSRDIWK